MCPEYGVTYLSGRTGLDLAGLLEPLVFLPPRSERSAQIVVHVEHAALFVLREVGVEPSRLRIAPAQRIQLSMRQLFRTMFLS
jgi:hypothetical protein